MERIRDVMDVKQVAEYTGLGRMKIYQLAKIHAIPCCRIDRQIKFLRVVVDEWLKEKADKFMAKEKENGRQDTGEQMDIG